MDRQRLARLSGLAFAVFGLAGCSSTLHHNEGSVHIAHLTNEFTSVFLSSDDDGAGTPIEKGEAISVKLISAYICDFREGTGQSDWFSRSNVDAEPCAGGDGNVNWLGSSNYTRGEIAIIANAGERSEAVGLSFNPADVHRKGRVVYYNEDIRESGQLINAMNIPVYGPKTYEGGPFYMDWAVLELDNDESSQARQLLEELARIGSKAYAPSTPILNVLNALGGALLGANGDDIELRYQLEFDPVYTGQTKVGAQSLKSRSVARAPLREGYYALVRKERRDQLPAFADLTIPANHNPVLYKGGTLFTEESWLLIRVAREDNSQALPQDFSTTTAEFLGQISGDKKQSIQDMKALIEALEKAQ